MAPPGLLIWDFDGTLASRPGNWTGALWEIVSSEYPGLGVTPDCLRRHLQSGFPWHTPEILRQPCSADEWWQQLLPILASAVQAGAGMEELEARRIAERMRVTYPDATYWRVFDDVRPVLTELKDRGWGHIILSNHIPELAQLVNAVGLQDLVLEVYSSACTGAEKPHAQAFETVFRRYPSASAGWMIGDSWRADVLGARAVGLRAILVRSKHPQAQLQCETLHEVIDIVRSD